MCVVSSVYTGRSESGARPVLALNEENIPAVVVLQIAAVTKTDHFKGHGKSNVAGGILWVAFMGKFL